MVYHHFLKGGVGGDGPSKEEFKLRCVQRRAQRTGDPAVLQKVLLNFEGGDDFCTRSPHLKGVEVFNSQKRKSDTPIGADDDTHRPDTLNYSHPRVAQRTTRSHASPLPTIIEESSPSILEVSPPPTGLGFCRVTTVEESEVDKKLWHNVRVSYNFSKACWTMHVVTKKKCIAKIISNSKSIPAPAYLGIWNYYKFTTPKVEKFFFPDDIECCVKGSRRKWVDNSL